MLCWSIKQTTCSSSEAADTYPGLASARCDSRSLLHPAVCTNTKHKTHPWSSTEPRAGEFSLGSKSLDPEGWVMAGRLAVWSHLKLPSEKMGIFPMGLSTTIRNISVQKQRDFPRYRLAATGYPEIAKGNQHCYKKSLIQDHIPFAKQQEQFPPLSDFPPECRMEQRAETAHESWNHRTVRAARDL